MKEIIFSMNEWYNHYKDTLDAYKEKFEQGKDTTGLDTIIAQWTLKF